MSYDVLFRSAAAVLFSLQIYVLHIPFSCGHSIREDKHCPNRPMPDHTKAEGDCKNVPFGRTCTFKCDEGYELKGADVIFCQKNLEWTDDLPQCIKKESEFCPEIHDPENGHSHGSCKKAVRGELCTFLCNDGYLLQGKGELFCTASLKWNGVEPRCVKNEQEFCPELQDPKNGHSHGPCKNAVRGESCTFLCNDGYLLQGKGELFCTASLKWNGVEPRCVKNGKCEQPKNPDHGSFKCSTDNEECELSCDEGYTIHGKNKITCSDGSWVDNVPTCIRDGKCEQPKNPDHGSFKCITDKAVCELSCDEGYTMDGKNKINCRNGSWVDKVPTCIREKSDVCPKLQLSEYAVLNGSCVNAKRGEICFFKCKDGYVIQGKEALICTSNLHWNGVVPRCSKRETEFCLNLQMPENGHAYGPCKEAMSGEKCIFKCNDGYRLQGRGELLCTASLQWNGEVPLCVKIEFCPRLRTPPNAVWQGSCKKGKPGQTCSYKCNEGYVLDGKKELICLATFNWSGELPRCFYKGNQKNFCCGEQERKRKRHIRNFAGLKKEKFYAEKQKRTDVM